MTFRKKKSGVNRGLVQVCRTSLTGQIIRIVRIVRIRKFIKKQVQRSALYSYFVLTSNTIGTM